MAPGTRHLRETQLCSMHLAALTSALAQKLSLPTLLISDMALVFWYTEPCGGQRLTMGPPSGAQDTSKPRGQQLAKAAALGLGPLQKTSEQQDGLRALETAMQRRGGLWLHLAPVDGSLSTSLRQLITSSVQRLSTYPSHDLGNGLPRTGVSGVHHLQFLHGAHHPRLCRTRWCGGLVTGLSPGCKRLLTASGATRQGGGLVPHGQLHLPHQGVAPASMQHGVTICTLIWLRDQKPGRQEPRQHSPQGPGGPCPGNGRSPCGRRSWHRRLWPPSA